MSQDATDRPRATPPITFVRVEDRAPTGSLHAVYPRLVYADSTGSEFYFDACSFLFNLKPCEPNPEKP